jgi:UDP-N-acetylmuramate dehydrogenase
MRLGGPARYLAEAHSVDEIEELVKWAKAQPLNFIMIGQGSNIVWRDEGYDGLVIVNRLSGKELLSEDDDTATIHLAGGEVWDEAVAWTAEQNLTGLEFLSLIPGTVGAAPVQNIGAYGGELSSVIKSVEVYDSQEECFESLMAQACNFSYRSSRFKIADRGRFLITGLVVTLLKANPAPPFYESLQTYLDEHNITELTPAIIRQAVIAIRNSKLPDPKTVANNGSFFTNPIIPQEEFEQLKQQYPGIKGWPTDSGQVKLAAGWLVEQAGFRGVHDQETGMATWGKQALVLVNEHANSTADLLKFRQKIIDKVNEMFGVTLEQEPELLP